MVSHYHVSFVLRSFALARNFADVRPRIAIRGFAICTSHFRDLPPAFLLVSLSLCPFLELPIRFPGESRLSMYEFGVCINNMVGFARGEVALSVAGAPCWHSGFDATYYGPLPDERFADLALPHFAFAIGGSECPVSSAQWPFADSRKNPTSPIANPRKCDVAIRESADFCTAFFLSLFDAFVGIA